MQMTVDQATNPYFIQVLGIDFETGEVEKRFDGSLSVECSTTTPIPITCGFAETNIPKNTLYFIDASAHAHFANMTFEACSSHLNDSVIIEQRRVMGHGP